MALEALTVFPWIPKSLTNHNKQHIVHIPGIARKEDGQTNSVWLQVYGFNLYYYFKLTNRVQWNEGMASGVVQQIQDHFRERAPICGKLVFRQCFQLYEPDIKIPFLQLEFCDAIHMYTIRKHLRENPDFAQFLGLTGDVYEDDIYAELKLNTACNMSFSEWFTCQGQHVPEASRVSFGSADHREYLVDWRTIKKVPMEICSLWLVEPNIMSFDIEAYSGDKHRMPNPYFIEECMYLNVCTFQKLGHPNTRHREVLTLLPVDDIEGVTIHFTPDEITMCNKFAELINQYQPDVIIGYNICGFDIEYMHKRRKLFERGRACWPTMGRLLYQNHSDLVDINWSSSGAGDIKAKTLDLAGRFIVDIYYYILRKFKLLEYNLSYVSREFLKEDKHPIKPDEQFKIFREYRNALQQLNNQNGQLTMEQSEQLISAKNEYRKLVKYCIQDAELVMKLFEFHNIYFNLRSQSKATNVPIDFIITKGETIKTTSMLYSVAHKKGYVMTPIEKQDYDYEGGLVQNPIPGFSSFVVCEDFSSMYPSIMIAINGCPTTLVPDYLPVRMLVCLASGDAYSIKGKVIGNWSKVYVSYEIVANPDFRGYDQVPPTLPYLIKYQYKLMEPGTYRYETDEELCHRWNHVFASIKVAKNPAYKSEKETPGVCPQIYVPPKYQPMAIEQVSQIKLLNNEQVNSVIVPPKDGPEATLVQFVKKELRKGVAPEKAEDLVRERGIYKRVLKKWTDSAGVLHPPKHNKVELAQCVEADCMQNSLKIAVNAEYGYFGASFNKYAEIRVAMAITAMGRTLAEMCVDYVVKKYNATVVYGDTDSIMFKIPSVKTGKDCHVIGQKIADELTAMFPPPLVIAYEKSMNIFLLRKKHYIYVPIAPDGTPNEKKVSARGVIIARRDYCIWVQEVYKELVMMILRGEGLVPCLEVIIREIVRLFRGEVPMEKLALVKRYTSKAGDDYHITQFVQRKRLPPPHGSNRTINFGERIKFIYIVRPAIIGKRGGKKEVRGMEKMEMFDEFDPSVMQLDYFHYFEHQFMKPIDNLVGTAFVKEFTAPHIRNQVYDPVKGLSSRKKVKLWRFDKDDQCERGCPVKVMKAMILDGVDIRKLVELMKAPAPLFTLETSQTKVLA